MCIIHRKIRPGISCFNSIFCTTTVLQIMDLTPETGQHVVLRGWIFWSNFGGMCINCGCRNNLSFSVHTWRLLAESGLYLVRRTSLNHPFYLTLISLSACQPVQSTTHETLVCAIEFLFPWQPQDITVFLWINTLGPKAENEPLTLSDQGRHLNTWTLCAKNVIQIG